MSEGLLTLYSRKSETGNIRMTIPVFLLVATATTSVFVVVVKKKEGTLSTGIFILPQCSSDDWLQVNARKKRQRRTDGGAKSNGQEPFLAVCLKDQSDQIGNAYAHYTFADGSQSRTKKMPTQLISLLMFSPTN